MRLKMETQEESKIDFNKNGKFEKLDTENDPISFSVS